jgi:hypothetical protein
MWLIALLVVPIVALIVLGLIVSTVLAVVFAAVAYLLPVLLIVGGVWLLARALSGADDQRQARRDARAQWRGPCRPPAGARQVPQRPAERRPAGPPRRELPLDVQVKAEQIRHKVDVLLGYADRFSPFSHDLYLVRQVAADYLPRTIGAYLAIPGTNDPAIDASGRTALGELRAQLAILDARLDDITQNLQRQDLDGLLANRRFLEERFGLQAGVAPVRTVDPDPGAATQEPRRRFA